MCLTSGNFAAPTGHTNGQPRGVEAHLRHQFWLPWEPIWPLS